MNTKQIRLKAVPVGTLFTHRGQAYRLQSKRKAVALLPSGRGRVHATVTLPRNTFVEILP